MSTLKVDGIRSNSASSDAITLASDGTCTANLSGRQNPNLIINGAMLVAQRGTSSNTDGYLLDRFNVFDGSSLDESVTRAQVDVASGTTPYTLGFRKALKLTNGNQTSGAQADSNVQIRHKLEAQDIANSGWNYTSASSFITLSFWVKSSVAQNFYVYLRTTDGTGQRYAFETGSLTANTWTKVTNTIAGNSNLTFDNNNGEGLEINISPHWGTNYTSSGVSLNTWDAYASGTRTPDFATTWFTTNDATFEITGLQLEVSDHATSFQFEPFETTLRKCLRYYQKSYSYPVVPGTASVNSGMITGSVSDARTQRLDLGTRFEVQFRSTPTVIIHRPFSGATGQLENFGAGNGTSSGNGRTYTMRGLGTKGLAGFTLQTSTGGTIGYHYQADAEL